MIHTIVDSMCIFALEKSEFVRGRIRSMAHGGQHCLFTRLASRLAKAELESLFPNNKLVQLESPRLVMLEGEINLEQARINVNSSSGIQAILTDCIIMDWDGNNNTKRKFITNIGKTIEKSDKSGSIGVFLGAKKGEYKD